MENAEIIAELNAILSLMNHNLSRVERLKDHISTEGYEHYRAYYSRKIEALIAAIDAIGSMPKATRSLLSLMTFGAAS